MTPIIFHIDVNSAFLSWTSVDNLKNNHGDGIDLRTIPAIIGGDPENRHGVVLAKSESYRRTGHLRVPKMSGSYDATAKS